MSEAEVCGNCIKNNSGLCIASGWLGCADDDLAKVKFDDKTCESFEWSESSE